MFAGSEDRVTIDRRNSARRHRWEFMIEELINMGPRGLIAKQIAHGFSVMGIDADVQMIQRIIKEQRISRENEHEQTKA